MNRLIIASAAAALMMGASVSAYAQATPADCQNLFQRADVNKDGSLQAEEAKVFIDAMNQAQVKPQDASMVKQDEFMQACEKNAFANIDPATIGTAASGTAASGTTASTETTTTGQGTTTTDQSASGTVTTDQSASGTATTTTDPAASGTATTTTTDQTASTDTTQQQTDQQEQALAAPSGLLASNIIGSTVYSQDNQSIGDINDIILSPEGQPSQVIVGVGGFLGIGEKDVVLDMSKLQIAATEDGDVKVVTQTSQDELRNMPAFMRPSAQGGNQQQQQQQ
jgi:PRC-barrel domain